MTTETARQYLEVERPDPLDPDNIHDPDAEDGLTDEAKQIYDQAYRYATRLFIEAGLEHERVTEAAIAFADAEDDAESNQARQAFRAAVAEHDPQRWGQLNGLGLSAFQGATAENTAAVILAAEERGVTCSGTTQDGEPCGRRVSDLGAYCHLHEDQTHD